MKRLVFKGHAISHYMDGAWHKVSMRSLMNKKGDQARASSAGPNGPQAGAWALSQGPEEPWKGLVQGREHFSGCVWKVNERMGQRRLREEAEKERRWRVYGEEEQCTLAEVLEQRREEEKKGKNEKETCETNESRSQGL